MSSKVNITDEGIECSVGEFKIQYNITLIEALKKEEDELLKKIEKSRDNNDFGLYKNLVRALTDVTCLKQRELANLPRETWKEKSSHYYEGDKAIKGENEYVTTWEQKGDEIRNKKTYKIEKEIPSVVMNIEIDKNYIVDGDNLTIPMKINGKDGYSIHGKKVDNKWVFKNGNTVKCN
jgi:hypothetical protein